MSIDELKEQIKNEVVLREGNVFTWQWRQLGLLTKAETLAITEDEFLALVNEISRSLNPYFGRISDLKVAIGQVAQRQNNQLTQEQINQFIGQAQALQLSAAFVSTYWIPVIVASLPKSAVSSQPLVEPSRQISVPSPPATTDSTLLDQTSEKAPSKKDQAKGIMIKEVRSYLDNNEGHIPASLLKELFLSTDYNQAQLAKIINGYLTVHNYTAETPTQGKTLTQQLLSTDWRIHLQTVEKFPPFQIQTGNQSPYVFKPAIVTIAGILLLLLILTLSGGLFKTRKSTEGSSYQSPYVTNSTMATDTTMATDSTSIMSADSAK